MLEQLILFVSIFLIVFLIYEIFLVRKCKKNMNRKKPAEVQYLMSRFKLDLKKINYKRLLNIVSLVSAIDISLVVAIMSLFNVFYLQLLVGFAAVFIIILVSYNFVGFVYKKKGCCKND